MLLKCKVDGFSVSGGEYRVGMGCPVCDAPLQYFCSACGSYSSTATCPGCRELSEWSNRLRDARHRNDFPAALLLARQLSAKYPARREFGVLLGQLEVAHDAVVRCDGISGINLDSARAVKEANGLITQAETACRVAGIGVPPSVERWRTHIAGALSELEQFERVRVQMVTAIGRAVDAALVFAAVVMISHLLGALAGRRTEPGSDPYSAYLTVRYVMIGLASAGLAAVIGRGSWNIPGPLVALITIVTMGMMTMFCTLAGGYWVFLIVTMIVAGTTTWVIEAGLAPINLLKDPLRGALARLAEGARGPSGKQAGCLVVLLYLVLFFWAPAVSIPSHVDETAVGVPFAGMTAQAVTLGAAPVAPAPAATTKTETDSPPAIPPTTTPPPADPVPDSQPAAEPASSPGNRYAQPAAAAGAASTSTSTNRPLAEAPAAVNSASDAGSSGAEQPAAGGAAVRIVSAVPAEPIETGTLTVALAAAGPGTVEAIEYQVNSEPDWQRTTDRVVQVGPLREGELRLRFRAVLANGWMSPVVGRVWQVASLKSVPLTLAAAIDPPSPRLGGSAALKLTCRRPSPGLVYKFRLPPATAWSDSRDGSFVFFVSKPALTIQYGVVDNKVGDHSGLLESKVAAVGNYYRVTNLELVDGKVSVSLQSDLGTATAVSVGDTVDECDVVSISLGQELVQLRGPDGNVFAVPIDRVMVENAKATWASQKLQAREQARTQARDGFRRGRN